MINTFRNNLKAAVLKESLNAANWKSESWKNLVPYVTQEVLNDAFIQHNKIKEIFKPVGTIIPRKCKQMSRITKKTTETADRGSEFFKVLCDFTAGRIHCQVNEIPNKIDIIRQITKDHNGIIHVRGESNDAPYGFCMKDGVFTDITQYAYVFLDEIGYPIELQIGHEFASYTFTIDSALRDNPNCGLTDLWKDGYYNKVKKYLLNKANKITDNSFSIYDVWDQGFILHNGVVSDDFRGLLNRLT